MNEKYFCNNCKEILQNNNDKLYCKKCSNTITIKNGYYDFLKEELSKKFLIKKHTVEDLLKEVDENGYNLGTKNFVKKNSIFKMNFLDPRFDQSADSVFHCLGENNHRCLVLGSGLGNKVEILSHIFNEVYSVETMDELLIFQNKKFNEGKITNIVTLRSKIETLPFIDNYFDFIVVGTAFSKFIEYYSKKQESSCSMILKEIKRVLNVGGCACLELENKSIYNLFFGNNMTSSNKKVKSLSHNEFSKIIKNCGLKSKTYWVLPSLDKPYFSSNIEDDLSIKWYYQNFKNFMKGTKIQLKYTIIYKIFSKLDKKIIKFLTKKFAPNFVYYCYKEKIPDSIEDYILKETNFSSCFTISRRIKTVFVLLNKFGKAKYIVHFKRYGKKFPNKIPLIKRVYPDMVNPDSRIWMEEWKNGRTLNPFNSNEITQAILWLFKFQDNSSQDRLTNNDLEEEINMIIENLNKNKNLNKIQYNNWLEDYKKFLEKNVIRKTAQHGDFAYANVLYDLETNEVNPVDWENYSSKGSPFKDFSSFIIRLMMQSSIDEVEDFRSKIQDKGKFRDLMINIQKLTNEHFKCYIDIDLIIKYAVLKKVAELIKIKKESAETYIKLLKILEKNNFALGNDK